MTERDEPCQSSCGRCSRCTRAAAVERNMKRYGQRDYPGNDHMPWDGDDK